MAGSTAIVHYQQRRDDRGRERDILERLITQGELRTTDLLLPHMIISIIVVSRLWSSCFKSCTADE